MTTRISLAHCAFHLAFSILLMATVTPAAAQYAPPTEPACTCGPSALPAYAPPYPQPALRPLDHTPRTGVSYREARGGYTAPRTNLGNSAYEPVVGPALWSGFYAGLHGGYAFSGTTLKDPRFGEVTTSGGFGGVHLGHNWQRGALVFGLEADVEKSFGDGRRAFASGYDISANRDWTGSARARAGYAFGDLLAYGTLGVAAAGQTITASQGGTSWRGPETHFGVVYGAGLEWQVARQISLRGEVLRYHFNDRNMYMSTGPSAVKLDDTVVRGGLSFRLN